MVLGFSLSSIGYPLSYSLGYCC